MRLHFKYPRNSGMHCSIPGYSNVPEDQVKSTAIDGFLNVFSELSC